LSDSHLHEDEGSGCGLVGCDSVIDRSRLPMCVGKSTSKLQMHIELKQIRVLICKMLLLFNIISLYTEALVPSFRQPLQTSCCRNQAVTSLQKGNYRHYSHCYWLVTRHGLPHNA
jgi:hypothetical protein